VKSLGSKVSADESTLEGTLAVVDQAARDLTLTAGSETIELGHSRGHTTRKRSRVDEQQVPVHPAVSTGSGGRIRTYDLRVMSGHTA
jgi:hypothetical protein